MDINKTNNPIKMCYRPRVFLKDEAHIVAKQIFNILSNQENGNESSFEISLYCNHDVQDH